MVPQLIDFMIKGYIFFSIKKIFFHDPMLPDTNVCQLRRDAFFACKKIMTQVLVCLKYVQKTGFSLVPSLSLPSRV